MCLKIISIIEKPNIKSFSNIKKMHMTKFLLLDKPLAIFTGKLKSTVISKKNLTINQKSYLY